MKRIRISVLIAILFSLTVQPTFAAEMTAQNRTGVNSPSLEEKDFIACLIADIKMIPEAKEFASPGYQKLEKDLTFALNAMGPLPPEPHALALKLGLTIGKYIGFNSVWWFGAVQDCWSTLVAIPGKNGTSCEKEGANEATNGVTFVCKMFGNKRLKWVYQPSPSQTVGVKNFAVNGIDRLTSPDKRINNRAGSTKWSNYLAVALTEVTGGEFVPIPWTGNWWDCGDQKFASRDLADRIEKAYKANKEMKINIVAHSHGTIIAYNALKLLEDTDIQVNNLLSIGTLIGPSRPSLVLEDNKCLVGGSSLDAFAKPSNVTNWVNVYSSEDSALSKPIDIPGVENIKWRLKSLDSHLEYFNDKRYAEVFTQCTRDGNCVPQLSAKLAADKYSGTTLLNAVSLTAMVTGSAQGTINYTFYCDRSDSGTNITFGWYEKFDGVSDNPKTATCNYPNSGTYTAKVIVERGTFQAEARVTVKVDSPVEDSLKLAPTISALGCSPTSLMIGQSVNCNPSFSGNVSSYSWSASGGSTALGSGLTFSTRFDSAGTKTITLRACNGSACASRAQDILVMPLTSLPAPTLTSPNGVTSVATTPTFSWSSVTGANGYWLMVATSAAAFPTDPNATSCPLCVSTGVSGNTDLTSHTLPNAFPNGGTTGTLSANTVYYWKVQAWNNATSPTTQGQYSATGSFTTAAAPESTISYVSPNPVVATGVAQPFTINGNNFASGATVTLRTSAGDVYPNRTISSLSATQIVINPNFGTVADTWTVEVISLSGVSSGRFAFTVTTPVVPAPTISYLSPNPVTGLNGAQTITIVGSNFVNKPTLTLTWSGQSNYTVPAAQVTYVNSTQLQMSINTTTFADNWTVKVTNPDGKLSNTVGFVVSAYKSDLVVEGLSPSPSSGLAGTNTTVSFTVRNQGAGPALPSTANLRINSSYSSVTTGEYLLTSVSVPRIEAGMSYSVNQSVTIPSSQSTGINYVWVILDVNSTANQSDGNNDKANAPFTVNAACSGVFCINDVVTVYGTGGIGLRLRQCARTDESLCPKVTTMPDGTQMIVFGGPAYGDGYTWWAISGYVSGIYRTGWAVQDYLRK